MPFNERYLLKQVKRDLAKKMVFVGGPRQVGKSTLAKTILGRNQLGYLNWDDPEGRAIILERKLPSVPLWVFDEIHKYKNWRNYLKGLFDVHGKKTKILVTGSARLDYYRRGGDSLQGRYHYLRLHPLSVAELKIKSQNDFDTLLTLGGFPEPFFGGSNIDAKRWSLDYRDRLIREDLVSLERITDLGNLELLMLRLPHLVGSPLSIDAVREDLQVSHKAVKNWLAILERLYAIYFVPPLAANLLRAVKKAQKHYHYDWSLVENQASRFENLVASHLLKWIHYQRDCLGEEYGLRYFKDVDGREVDFVIVKKDKPVLAVECKWSDDDVVKPLKYLKNKFAHIEAWQISATGKKDYVTAEGIKVCPAPIFLEGLV